VVEERKVRKKVLVWLYMCARPKRGEGLRRREKEGRCKSGREKRKTSSRAL